MRVGGNPFGSPGTSCQCNSGIWVVAKLTEARGHALHLSVKQTAGRANCAFFSNDLKKKKKQESKEQAAAAEPLGWVQTLKMVEVGIVSATLSSHSS